MDPGTYSALEVKAGTYTAPTLTLGHSARHLFNSDWPHQCLGWRWRSTTMPDCCIKVLQKYH